MKNLIKIFIIIFACLCLATCNNQNQDQSNDKFLNIGTFNIAWLGDGIDDTNPRTEEDYYTIANVIRDTKADILGLEEIENDNSLKLLCNHLNGYNYFISNSYGSQKPALLFKKGIEVNLIGDYSKLEVEPFQTRPGLLFKIKKGDFDWLMMVVHFKSTSHYDSTEFLLSESRRIRASQAKILSFWIDSVLAEGTEKDIIIVGDFNDYPERKNNATLTSLVDNDNIEFLTSGLKSCKFDYMNSIDHILITNSIKSRYLKNSVRTFNFFDSLPDNISSKVSDHCPVLITLNVSDKDND